MDLVTQRFSVSSFSLKQSVFFSSLLHFSWTHPLLFQLQRLKRSLSFKTKSVRSKSADNFFRNSSENKTELLSDVSSSTGHLYNIGMAPPHNTNLPIPPVPPAIPCAPPPTSRSQPRNPMQLDSAGHCFMEHIFKKPTFCDVCNHMIVGRGKSTALLHHNIKHSWEGKCLIIQWALQSYREEKPFNNELSTRCSSTRETCIKVCEGLNATWHVDLCSIIQYE